MLAIIILCNDSILIKISSMKIKNYYKKIII